MAPYIGMSNYNKTGTHEHTDGKTANAASTLFAPYSLVNIFLARRNHQWLLFCFILQAFLTGLFAPALKANFLTAEPDTDGWIIRATKRVTVLLTVTYSCQLLLLTGATVRLHGQSFGLIDDVAAILDQIKLIAKSNILEDFSGIESLPWQAWSGVLDELQLRLGYWRRSLSGHIWLGIGRVPSHRHAASSGIPTEARIDEGRPTHQLSSVAYLLGPFWIYTLLIITAGILAVAVTLLVFQFNGSFPMELNTYTFGIANVLVRFTPVGSLYVPFWAKADIWFRAFQPFASMHDPASARTYLLVEYVYDLPLVVTAKALRNKHWKVAWFSVLRLTSILAPVFAGAIFTVRLNGESRVILTMATLPLVGILVLLVIWLLSIPFIWPTAKRRLSCPLNSLGQLFALCYASMLLDLDAVNYPEADDKRKHA